MNRKIREIISYYKLSDRQFAIKIGVTQSVIGSMFQKNTEPSSKVIKLTMAAFPDVSSDWFIRDVGPMLKGDDKNIERISSLVDTIATLQQALNEKSKTIELLQDRINQLENQINKK